MKINKKEKPFTYDKYRRLGILNASDLEQVIMLELYSVFANKAWLFGGELDWDIKDMRSFVKDLAKKIKKCQS